MQQQQQQQQQMQLLQMQLQQLQQIQQPTQQQQQQMQQIEQMQQHIHQQMQYQQMQQQSLEQQTQQPSLERQMQQPPLEQQMQQPPLEQQLQQMQWLQMQLQQMQQIQQPTQQQLEQMEQMHHMYQQIQYQIQQHMQQQVQQEMQQQLQQAERWQQGAQTGAAGWHEQGVPAWWGRDGEWAVQQDQMRLEEQLLSTIEDAGENASCGAPPGPGEGVDSQSMAERRPDKRVGGPGKVKSGGKESGKPRKHKKLGSAQQTNSSLQADSQASTALQSSTEPLGPQTSSELPAPQPPKTQEPSAGQQGFQQQPSQQQPSLTGMSSGSSVPWTQCKPLDAGPRRSGRAELAQLDLHIGPDLTSCIDEPCGEASPAVAADEAPVKRPKAPASSSQTSGPRRKMQTNGSGETKAGNRSRQGAPSSGRESPAPSR